MRMEPSDLNTHLPPRKRLLAGLRTAAFDADRPPSPPADLSARLREMALAANASASTPDEMIEAARAAATAAADAAAAARAAAEEKAAVAAKARAAARAAMEFLDSFSRTRTRTRAGSSGLHLKVRSKKKHVQVKLLYKPPSSSSSFSANANGNGNGAFSSPTTGPKRPRNSAASARDDLHHHHQHQGEGVPADASTNANGSSSAHAPTPTQVASKGSSSVFKHDVPDKGSSKHSATKQSSDITDNGTGNLGAARKVKIKRKESPLNQKHTIQGETEHSVVTGESKSTGNGSEKEKKCVSPAADAKAPRNDGLAPTKMTSLWKAAKKFKTSHCSSDSKVLCSSPPAAETSSATVKAD